MPRGLFFGSSLLEGESIRMPGVHTVISRSNARALVVAGASSRAALVQALQGLNFVCAEVDDPYVAMAELCRRPLAYRAVVLSLAGFYREELALVRTVKQRFPHMDVWLTHCDGRHASLAEAMRLGADGLLGEDGLHRTAIAPRESETNGTPKETFDPKTTNGAHGVSAATTNGLSNTPLGDIDLNDDRPGDERDEQSDSDFVFGEPVLTADELRALLQEQPMASGDEA